MRKIFIVLMISLGLFCTLATLGVAKAVSPFTKTVPQDGASGAQTTTTTTTPSNACQTKQETIQTRSFALTKTMDNILAKFDLIDSRVRTYYTTKVLTQGKKVANYEALTAEITMKKKAAETNLAEANTKMTAFNCGSESPKDQLTQFRLSAQAVKKDLQDYRTAIKNLIVAIRAAK